MWIVPLLSFRLIAPMMLSQSSNNASGIPTLHLLSFILYLKRNLVIEFSIRTFPAGSTIRMNLPCLAFADIKTLRGRNNVKTPRTECGSIHPLITRL